MHSDQAAMMVKQLTRIADTLDFICEAIIEEVAVDGDDEEM